MIALSDVVQATFLRAVNHRRKFARVENAVAYLFQMARNEALRTRGKREIKFTSLWGLDAVSQGAGSNSFEEADAACRALEKLGGEDREIVELKIYAGLTFEEITKVTGAPAATVATRYRRALESLRPWLEKQFR